MIFLPGPKICPSGAEPDALLQLQNGPKFLTVGMEVFLIFMFLTQWKSGEAKGKPKAPVLSMTDSW